MKNFIEILKKVSLFYGIGEEDLSRMLGCLGAKIKAYEKKSTILEEGSNVREIGILLSGTAQLIRHDYYGNRSILLEVKPGDLFAESFACAELDEIPISVIAIEPCRVMLIECAHILRTCSGGCEFHHRMIYNLMRELAKKNLTYYRKISVTSKRTTRDKLLAYLDTEAKLAGCRKFKIPFDRQELADYLEVDRSGLSAEIGKLKKERILDSRKNEFTLF